MEGPAPPKTTTTVSWAATPMKVCRQCGTEYQLGLASWREHQRGEIHRMALDWHKARQRKAVELGDKEIDAYSTPAGKIVSPSQAELRTMLDEHEEGVLYLICMQGRYSNSIELAADYYETNIEVQESRVLEWNLIELLLDDLNKAGMVTYRLSPTPLGEVFVRIKPTKQAYLRIAEKYKIEFAWVHEVGHRFYSGQEKPLRAGDMTDFRSHPRFAVRPPEPPIREDFIDHCLACEVDHLNRHRSQLLELFGTDQL